MPATARDLLALKNSAVVFTCAPDASVMEACRLFRDRRVGALVVVRAGEVQGLLAERDVARRVVAEGRDPEQTPVRDVMDRQVEAVPLDASHDEVRARLRRAGYVVVLGARGLLGVLSRRDLARFQEGRARAAWDRFAHATVCPDLL